MSLPVHLVDDLSDTVVDDLISVDGDEGHHAVAVRRLKVGERVVLTDGRGVSVTGEIVATSKRAMQVRADEITRAPVPQPEFTVVQALPKGERGELAVEVMTEIGVSTVVPWAATRSIVSWKGERGIKPLARWRSTAREAAKQARRGWFPEVSDLAQTSEVIERIKASAAAIVLWESATGTMSDLALPATGEIVLVIGPEGSFTPEEITAFEDAGAVSVKMGAEVLRTSTAGLAATAALLSRTPRWG